MDAVPGLYTWRGLGGAAGMVFSRTQPLEILIVVKKKKPLEILRPVRLG
jgi:hypothetical protein